MTLLPAHADIKTTGARIPQERGHALSGTPVDLPAAFAGRPAVLVLGFSQAARDQLKGWDQRLAPDYPHGGEVAFFQIAEFAAVPRPLRGWVIRKVKASVPEGAQARFLIVTEHEAEWKSAAGYTTSGDAYVVVVDGSGNVRWRTHGAPTDAAYADIKRHLR